MAGCVVGVSEFEKDVSSCGGPVGASRNLDDRSVLFDREAIDNPRPWCG